ncbi:hypothetical protein ZHAS_00017079 [Anopheles sinensis]|uniref:Uncharacterized protein n=1 Tax=Anopheles sinensis TaxID=74873 RepID=A0A084WFS1_ANOSI|nr:hypothetical protein ZHAS_00017079 [Anopheles sinensis]
MPPNESALGVRGHTTKNNHSEQPTPFSLSGSLMRPFGGSTPDDATSTSSEWSNRRQNRRITYTRGLGRVI